MGTPCFVHFICLCFLLASTAYCFSHTPLLGVHPLDEKYYRSEVIKCKDGTKSFPRDRLNDNFCDCNDGTDEPGTSACPTGKFYCQNLGSKPQFIFSSRVNDLFCDCCDGSDEYDGSIHCPNTCVMGGNVEYRSDVVSSGVKKTNDGVKLEESVYNLTGSLCFATSCFSTTLVCQDWGSKQRSNKEILSFIFVLFGNNALRFSESLHCKAELEAKTLKKMSDFISFESC